MGTAPELGYPDRMGERPQGRVPLLDIWVPTRVLESGSEAEADRFRALGATVSLALLAVFVNIVVRESIDALQTTQLWPSFASAALLVAALVAFIRDRYQLGVHLALLAVTGGIVAEVWFVAGPSSPALAALGLVPLGATMLLGRRAALGWGCVAFGSVVAIGTAQLNGRVFPALPPDVSDRQHLGAALSIVVQAWVLGALFLRQQRTLVERLTARETKVVRAVAAGDVWLWQIDPRGVFTTSEALAALLGVPPESELTATTLLARVAPADRDVVAAALARALEPTAGSTTIHAEFRLDRAETRWLRLTGQSARGSEWGDGAVGAMVDITEERAHAAAREAYVAEASHELRAPLTALTGAVRLLDHVLPLEGEAAALRGIVRSNSERLLALVNDLLDLSRIDAGQMPVDLRETDLAPLLTRVAAAFPAGGARLRVDAPVSLRWTTDPARLEQVVVNLLTNAWRVSPADTEVVLRARPTPDALLIEVVDHGPGIPEAQQAALFSRFHQVEGRPRGTGLGLAISAQLAARLGGVLSYEAAVGGGSVFTLRLAAVRPEGTGEGAGR